jgi:hypothetical protein
MNEIEIAIYRHLTAPFRDLMDTFIERNPNATFDQALKWVAAVIVAENKIMDKIIAELPPIEEQTFIPLREFRNQVRSEIEQLEERNGI